MNNDVSMLKTTRSLNTQYRAYLQKLIAMFLDYPLAIEVRHSGWNDPNLLCELAALGVGFVNVDRPPIRRAMRWTAPPAPSGTCDCTGATTSSGSRSKNAKTATTSSVRQISSNPEGTHRRDRRQAETTFVVANDHYLGKAAANATELKSMLSGKNVKAPPDLIRTYPDLTGYAVS